MYYLHSRYYDPEVGRFINADDSANLGADDTILSHNLFAYCGNNPVGTTDETGQWFNTILGTVIGGITAVITRDKENETWQQALCRGALTGFVGGLMLDISIATAGVGGLAIAAVGGAIASGGNSAWEQYNTHGEIYDVKTVALDALIGAGMNTVFSAYGRTPTRVTGTSAKEVFHAVTQNAVNNSTTKAGAFLATKFWNSVALSTAEASTQNLFSFAYGKAINRLFA